jgi:hypothetical protein
MRSMFDGVTPDLVPGGAAIYAGYDDGTWQSHDALAAKYPTALHVSICVTASGSARVLDIETGDATPAQAPGWVKRMRAAGNPYPVCYMNASTWPAVKEAFAAQHVAAPLYWVAEYVDDPAKPPQIPDGAVAIQFYDYGGYDASLVAAYWPGLDPAPQAAPEAAQTVPQEDDVTTYYPIQVLPDPDGSPNACGVCSWPAGNAGTPGVPHVLQLMADPGFWADTVGEFRLSFDMTSGGDVETTAVAKPSGSVAVELASVPGYNPAICRGVTITRPDGKKWPWGGGAE